MTTVEIDCQLVAEFVGVDLAVDRQLVESLNQMVHLELLAGKLYHQLGLFRFVRSLKQ